MTGPRLTGCRCQCAACGEYFGSERAFDRHRIGDFAPPGEWQGTRRCLPLADMLAAGWTRSERGFLLTPDPRRAGAGIQGQRATPAAMWIQGAMA
jgi:hypothetical protein